MQYCEMNPRGKTQHTDEGAETIQRLIHEPISPAGTHVKQPGSLLHLVHSLGAGLNRFSEPARSRPVYSGARY
jgi:hypothetical protein